MKVYDLHCDTISSRPLLFFWTKKIQKTVLQRRKK